MNNNYGIIGITDSRATDYISSELSSSSYPNRFNLSTEIRFDLYSDSHVELIIYYALG